VSSQFNAVRGDLAGKIDGFSERTDNVRKEVTVKIDELGGRIDAVRGELFIVKESIASLKVWALGLYAALAASLLLVMARGFKWL
jgi:hypothetical protein